MLSALQPDAIGLAARRYRLCRTTHTDVAKLIAVGVYARYVRTTHTNVAKLIAVGVYARYVRSQVLHAIVEVIMIALVRSFREPNMSTRAHASCRNAQAGCQLR